MSQTFAGLGIHFLLSQFALLCSVANRTQSNRHRSIEQPWGRDHRKVENLTDLPEADPLTLLLTYWRD